jgi:hypothetical protein
MLPSLKKECPHCHEQCFGWRELWALDYFRAENCKVCGGPVRNDGFRQFLIFPAILLALFAGFILISLLPDSLGPFGLLIPGALLLLTHVCFAKPVKSTYPMIDKASAALDPNNDKTILVRGWNKAELEWIIDVFTAEHSSASVATIEIHESEANLFRLTFPEDIPFDHFAYLVNFLNYPTNLEPAERSISVVGRLTLSAGIHGLESLVGQTAIVYVPEGDRDYDVVYLQTESGSGGWSNCFSEGVWHRVNDARLSDETRHLISYDVPDSSYRRRFQV